VSYRGHVLAYLMKTAALWTHLNEREAGSFHFKALNQAPFTHGGASFEPFINNTIVALHFPIHQRQVRLLDVALKKLCKQFGVRAIILGEDDYPRRRFIETTHHPSLVRTVQITELSVENIHGGIDEREGGAPARGFGWMCQTIRRLEQRAHVGFVKENPNVS